MGDRLQFGDHAQRQAADFGEPGEHGAKPRAADYQHARLEPCAIGALMRHREVLCIHVLQQLGFERVAQQPLLFAARGFRNAGLECAALGAAQHEFAMRHDRPVRGFRVAFLHDPVALVEQHPRR